MLEKIKEILEEQAGVEGVEITPASNMTKTENSGANVLPVKTMTVSASGDRPVRNLPVYSDEIGAVVKTVEFGPGKPVRASCKLAPDDLYIRARVESNEPAVYPNALANMHPPMKTAWTQPYRREIGRIVRAARRVSESGAK